MTYKETLFFVGKCLTINHEEHNKVLVEQELKSGKVDWDNVVKLSTAHYVFPALYCNLMRADFIHYLPTDLVEYMKHVTGLNRERNQQIIEQAKEINELLLTNNITPIFLKGTGNLLEGLYEDIGERMVGDIDFLVTKKDFDKSIKTLNQFGYKKKEKKKHYDVLMHYPKMIKLNKISSIEIHSYIISKRYENVLTVNSLFKSLLIKNNFHFLSNSNKFIYNITNHIINDYAYWLKNISLRNTYDFYLLSKLNSRDSFPCKNKKILKKIQKYIQVYHKILNHNAKKNDTFYLKKVLKINSKKKSKIIFTKITLSFKEYFFYFKKSFFDKKYREYFLEKVLDLKTYKKIFNQ